MFHVSKRVLRYRGPLTPDRYNKFFYPNLCHVCKVKDNGNLITCHQCHMISYCSTKHKMLHHEEHMQICGILKNYLEIDPQWGYHCLNQEHWVESRRIFLHSVKVHMSRELQLYEEQMIVFAKSCLLCHQQINLHVCQQCYAVNYCDFHKTQFEQYHNDKCIIFKICVNLDIKSLENDSILLGFCKFPDETKPLINMNAFLQEYVTRNRIPNEMCRWRFKDYIYSEYVTAPLTLYNALKCTELLHVLCKQNGACVIHIIIGTYLDRHYLAAWELLLHLLRNIKLLTIVLIGTNLQNECDNIDACLTCRIIHEQRLYFETHNMLYYNYVKSEFYKQPNVIIGFEVGVYGNYEFHDKYVLQNLLAMRNQNCPLLIAATSFRKLVDTSRIIRLNIGTFPLLSNTAINSFCSIRPWRDFERGNICYRNAYFVVYKDLYNLS